MRTEKEKMIGGELYDAKDPQLVEDRNHAQGVCRAYKQSAVNELDDRSELLANLLQVEDRFFIRPPFYCDYGYNIKLGNDVYLNFDCVILDVCSVEIGEGSMLGPSTHIYAATHPTDPRQRALGLECGKRVIIGKNVWIGGKTVIMPGVTIGDNAVIGAGSVVINDIPANALAAGNPARIIRDL